MKCKNGHRVLINHDYDWGWRAICNNENCEYSSEYCRGLGHAEDVASNVDLKSYVQSILDARVDEEG